MPHSYITDNQTAKPRRRRARSNLTKTIPANEAHSRDVETLPYELQ